jgi:hypothetical protein
MIPEGMYRARGLSLSEGESKLKKSPGVTVVFSITQDGPHKGQTIDWNGWWSDKAKDRTAESLTLCGYDGVNPASIGANEVLLIVEHEDVPPDPNNPTAPTRKRPKVAWVNDPERGGSGMVPMEGAQLEQFRADIRGVLAAKREEMAKKKAANGDSASFNYGANGMQGAPSPPPAPPPAAQKAPPRF